MEKKSRKEEIIAMLLKKGLAKDVAEVIYRGTISKAEEAKEKTELIRLDVLNRIENDTWFFICELLKIGRFKDAGKISDCRTKISNVLNGGLTYQQLEKERIVK